MGGAGKPFIPQVIRGALDPSLYSHTDEPIDFAALRGKRVGVLGAASSALDVAAAALEQGAARADLFCRHPDLVRVTTIKGMAYAGVMDHYHELPDDRKWELMHHYYARSAGPIANTVRRAFAQEAFHLHFGKTWDALWQEGDTVVVEAGASGTFSTMWLPEPAMSRTSPPGPSWRRCRTRSPCGAIVSPRPRGWSRTALAAIPISMRALPLPNARPARCRNWRISIASTTARR